MANPRRTIYWHLWRWQTQGEQFTDICEDGKPKENCSLTFVKMANPRRTIHWHLWSRQCQGCKNIYFSVTWKLYAQNFCWWHTVGKRSSVYPSFFPSLCLDEHVEGHILSSAILCIMKLYAICLFIKLLSMIMLLTGLIEVYWLERCPRDGGLRRLSVHFRLRFILLQLSSCSTATVCSSLEFKTGRVGQTDWVVTSAVGRALV